MSSEFWSDLLRRSLDWSINSLPGILLIVVLFFISLRLVKFAVNHLESFVFKRALKGENELSDRETEKRVNTLIGIVKGLGKVIIYGLFIMILLRKLGIDIAPILAGAGIIGLAVGFGAQELVRDIISGFFILLEDQLRTGDIANINGTAGLVENIELRTITLRDLSGTVHIIQNGKINSLSNLSKEWSAIVLDIGVAYKENADHVMAIMKKVGGEMLNDEELKDSFLEPIEILGLDSFGDSAIVIRARIKTRTGEQFGIGREYRRRLKIAFDHEGIEIPFPHQTIYWGDKIAPLRVNLKNEESGT